MPESAEFYTIWTGALNLGDTPGVFTDASFVGLVVQIPLTITFLPEGFKDPVWFLLETTEVETFGEAQHPILWDWKPGTPLTTPVGAINNKDLTAGETERHFVQLSAEQATPGPHSLTILVNPEVGAGLKDDFILRRLGASQQIGARVGW